MEAAAELPAWLRALEPLSVPFVILLMLAGWLLEVKRDRERRRRYDARLRARAYALAAIIDEWLYLWPEWGYDEDADPPGADEVESALRDLRQHCPKARSILENMVEDAPEASGDLADVVERVYPKLLDFIRQLEYIDYQVSQPEGAPTWTVAGGAPMTLRLDHETVIEVFNLLHPHTLEFRQHTNW